MITASNAGMVTILRGGVSAGARKTKIATGKLYNIAVTEDGQEGIVNPAVTSGVLTINGSVGELRDQKLEIPGEVFVGAGILNDFNGSAARAGLGVRAGWRHTLKPWSGAVYGNHKAKPGSFASITAPKGAFFVNPEFLLGFDISQISVLASAGIDCSYNTFKFNLGDVPSIAATSVSNWLFGLRAGLEMICPIGPCFGLGFGVFGTYWPKAMNKLNQKGKFAEFVSSKADAEKVEVANAGGTWSIMGQITANLTVN